MKHCSIRLASNFGSQWVSPPFRNSLELTAQNAPYYILTLGLYDDAGGGVMDGAQAANWRGF
ncbi:MAG: hypothetical protein CMG46_06655 [Candidatus Marinimicrobia bacterium]|nr:hypothetical protein [Candidatus Neomarinimicrobiota bacterium]